MASVEKNIKNNSISLVNIGISQSQGLELIINNLSCIEQSLSNILSRFQNKYALYKVNIKDYLQRINSCQKKILALQDQKKAITFISPSYFFQKFKLSQNNKQSLSYDYQQRVDFSIIQNNNHHLLNAEPEDQDSFNGEDAEVELFEKVVSQSQGLKNREKNPFFNCSFSPKDNDTHFGTCPKKIKCAESLLVFNTKMNPFRKNQKEDNPAISNKNRQKLKKQRDQYPINQLQAAPIGIRDQISIYQSSDLTYKPQKPEIVNDISIPSNLDLDALAEDFEVENNCLSQIQLSKDCCSQKLQISDPFQNLQPSIDSPIQNHQNNQYQQILSQQINQNQNICQEYQQKYSADPQESQINIEQLPFVSIPLKSIINAAPICQNDIFQQQDTQLVSYQQELITSKEEDQYQIEIQQNDQNGFLKEILVHKLQLKPTVTNERDGINRRQNQQFVQKEGDKIDIIRIMSIRRLERQPPSKEGKGPRNRVGGFSDSSDDIDQEYF
ncbi:hypothetical protein ABPG72_019220 [Tetrahymena utriculariae]